MIGEERLWLDVLNSKHECGPSYSDYPPLDLTHEGVICPRLDP